MKTSKRLLAIMMVICISFFALCFPAYADIEMVASGTCGADGDNITWTLDSEGVLTISGEGRMFDFYSCSLTPWYYQYEKIQCIRISEGVTSIGHCAFSGCSSLTSITIPDSVTSIGVQAFDGCSSLTNIMIPDSVTSIGDNAFHGCSSLTSITIPDGVTSIGDYAFSGCSSMASITISDSVTSIGVCAFYGCSSLMEINVDENNGVYSDYEGVLYKDDLITVLCCPPGKRGEITIVDGTTTIGDYAFSSCSSLTSITIPDSVTSIGDNAFHGCSSLTSITIPDSVTSIEFKTFFECCSLTSIMIPDSVTSIGDAAFDGCSSLTSITIPDSVTSIGYRAFACCSSLTSITIPDSVTSIEFETFFECCSLTSIMIPDSVTSIGDEAFRGCSSLTSITIPDSVTSIGYGAFYGCSSLTSITIPDSVTSIGYGVFISCSSMASITIPDSVTSIGGEAFRGCSSLTCITIPDSVTSIEHGVFSGCSSLTNIMIPDSVTNIGEYAFSGCNSLTSITIPDSVTSIGYNAFYGCWSLTSVTIPDSVTSIGEYTFYECRSLKSITIPDSVTNIGEYAFDYCDALKYIFFGGTQEQWEIIDNKPTSGTVHYSSTDHTFTDEYVVDKAPTCTEDGSKSKHCVYCDYTMDATIIPALGHDFVNGVCSRCGEIGNATSGTCGANGDNLTWTLDNEGVLTISGEGEMQDFVPPENPPWFSQRDNILCIRISEGVTSIGERAFFGCDTTTIEISNSVASIGSGAFSYCSSLASITIPDSVTSIGDYPFWSCSSLTDIYVDQNNETYSDHDGILYKDDTTTIICCPSGKSGEVTIVDGTTAIGDEAFMGCINLTCVTIPESVTTIGSSAFCYCYGLTSITIPDSVTSLGDNVFHACRGLTGITIPKNVVNIGERAFDYCGNLVNIYVDENNSIYSDYEGVLYKDALTTVIRCPSGKSGEIAIADGAAFIGEGAFDYCNSLTSITIPDSVTSIGDWAFRGCSSLKSITIPDSVTSIGEYAFSECSSLKYIFFGGSPIMWNNLLNRPADGVVHYYATGHTLGDGEIMTGPTCTTEGVSCKHCIVDNCDYSMTESIPALGHAWGGWAVTTAPGCETDGEETRVCANDNSHVETRVIPSIGHDWDEGTVIKEPTYSDEGLILYTCKNDPNHTYTEVLPKLDRPDESIILRIAGSNRSATAIEAAKQLKARKGIEKFDNIVIASGTGFADALSASYLAYKKDGPILLVDKSSITTITDFVNENLATGGKVFIVGGEGAVSMEVDANIIAGSGNNSVVRLAGKDRYLTNIMVLNEAGVAGEDLLVASGTGFADALSASAAKKPIFLVGKSLSDSQKTYLNSHKSSLSGKYYVIGGTGAVTQDVEDALTGYGTVQRLQGSDRYATSIAVADEFFPGNVDTVVVAFGTNFPDGLSGGPIAAAYDAPLILVTDKNYAHAVKQFAEKNAFQLVVMGGTGVISDDTAQKIAYNLQ